MIKDVIKEEKEIVHKGNCGRSVEQIKRFRICKGSEAFFCVVGESGRKSCGGWKGEEKAIASLK